MQCGAVNKSIMGAEFQPAPSISAMNYRNLLYTLSSHIA